MCDNKLQKAAIQMMDANLFNLHLLPL